MRFTNRLTAWQTDWIFKNLLAEITIENGIELKHLKKKYKYLQLKVYSFNFVSSKYIIAYFYKLSVSLFEVF